MLPGFLLSPFDCIQGQDLTSAPPSRQYVAAFYWMLISTLTIGYGDISAVTTLEQCAVVCAVLTGVLFIGYAIKCITDIMVEQAVQVLQQPRQLLATGMVLKLSMQCTTD